MELRKEIRKILNTPCDDCPKQDSCRDLENSESLCSRDEDRLVELFNTEPQAEALQITMKLFMKGLVCRIIGHKWKPAAFSYWARDEEADWIHIKEEARHCGRCGKFHVPHSRFFSKAVRIPRMGLISIEDLIK